MGKAWEAVPGRTNNPAGETGVVYLPLIVAGSLQAVSTVAETKVTFPPEVLAKDPALAGVEVRVPPNALLSDNGTRGGRVGIAPVAPDRIPSPLPPGLALPLVITIQTDGPENFDQPVPVRFPNLPDPVTGRKLGPGEKSALWSFNHDTGRWEIVGPMTVSADGNYAECDPGVGVRQPGWHGVQPGVGAGGGPLGGPDPCGGGGGGGAGGRNCRQNPGFPPDDPANYNGCGPDGWDYLVPDNPNGLLFPCATFFDACKAHDIGYNTCGKPKQQTDDQFLQGMLAACECLDGLKKDECRGLAVLYHRAVTGGGADAYNDAQDKACVCDDPPPPPPDCGGGAGSSPSLLATPGARDLSRRLALHATRPGATGSGAALIPQLGPHRFAVVDVRTGTVVQRGHAGSAGVAFAELILAPRTTYDVAILQEKTLNEGKVRITTGESGSRIEIPPILIKPPVSWDFDGDGLHDVGELVLGTDPRVADSDGDGVPDALEAALGTDPRNPDSNGNGILDGQEDFDADGLRTGWEIVNGLDPRKPDSDGDGERDGDEDLDNDGVSNRREHDANLNALSADTDGDGWDDGGELAGGSDPGNADSRPVLVVASLPVSVLNAAPEAPAAGTALLVVSPAVAYLNAAPAALPAGTAVEVSSALVSYLNARPDVPPPEAFLEAISSTVSYLNADPPVLTGTVSVPSPVVSYHNQ